MALAKLLEQFFKVSKLSSTNTPQTKNVGELQIGSTIRRKIIKQSCQSEQPIDVRTSPCLKIIRVLWLLKFIWIFKIWKSTQPKRYIFCIVDRFWLLKSNVDLRLWIKIYYLLRKHKMMWFNHLNCYRNCLWDVHRNVWSSDYDRNNTPMRH